jgi:hypothetical protein
MKNLWFATAVIWVSITAAVGMNLAGCHSAQTPASEATFERTLSVSGRVELSVETGAGNIHLTRGADNQIHIFGRVKSGWGDSEQRVREIAANPPIEQTGNIVRIGGHHENLRNISIDYEIQAPGNAFLNTASGSGDTTVADVGENTKISTGSGNIHATGLHGGFTMNSGSGDIYVEQASEGDVKVQAGSGNIELRNLRGGLLAKTGSGNIKVAGAPTVDWKLETGSGDVDFWSGNAALTLDASTGSGDIHSDREILTNGFSDHHHLTGKLNGGGTTVRIETGSGDIHVH